MRDIAGWQRRYLAGPVVWAVLDPEGDLTELYESKEAAALQVEWERRRGLHRYRAAKFHVHTLDLARERWADDAPAPDARAEGDP